jgi:hypothetical protein
VSFLQLSVSNYIFHAPLCLQARQGFNKIKNIVLNTKCWRSGSDLDNLYLNKTHFSTVLEKKLFTSSAANPDPYSH